MESNLSFIAKKDHGTVFEESYRSEIYDITEKFRFMAERKLEKAYLETESGKGKENAKNDNLFW